MEELFNPNFDWKALSNERGARVESVLREVCEVLTAHGRRGIQMDNGTVYQPAYYQEVKQAQEAAAMQAGMQLAKESGGGFITPDMYANYFAAKQVILPHDVMEPDTSYLDWMVQRKMVDELEERSEWGFTVEFVRMRRAGHIQYGKFLDNSASMTNEEWGAGIEIFRTWFETNKFGIKMSALAPEFRYAYFNQIADIIYTALIAAGMSAPSATSNTVVTDLNTAMYDLMRYEQTWNSHKPFENASFRLIAPPEFERYMNAAQAATYTGVQVTEQLSKRIATTYTPKLPFAKDACKVYLVVENWKPNEFATRVPYGVFGQSTDIDVFADKVAYRGAWGHNIDVNSGITLTFDTDTSFFIAPPVPTVVIP